MLSLALAVTSLVRDFTLVTGYVNQSFPQPLNKEQERECFERWQNGDREAYHTLIEHNLRLVAHVAKKFDSSGIDHDDLISIGSVGLIKAVETYQPTKGTKFATYAARCIQNEILMSKGKLRNIPHLSFIYNSIALPTSRENRIPHQWNGRWSAAPSSTLDTSAANQVPF